MSFTDLLITAIALSMDAFAVAVGKGLSVQKIRPKHWLLTGAYFGGFQALMPLIGFALASAFAEYIRNFDHWIAFVLMTLIGGNMIKESFEKEEAPLNSSFHFRTMLPLAIATSIDALAAGVSFAVTGANIWFAVSCIGITTFLFSAAGIKIGNIFGTKYKNKAEAVGGLILILMGLKILIEHLSGKA